MTVLKDTNTKQERDKLRELAEKATPGPWEFGHIQSEGEYGSDDDGGYGYRSYEVADNEGRCLMDCLNNDNGMVEVGHDGIAWDSIAERNAEFVAAANPATILTLLDMIDRPAASGDVRAEEFSTHQVIGNIIDKMSQIQMLWGLNEPGALVRFSDVSNILFSASKACMAPLAASAERAPVVGLSDDLAWQLIRKALGYDSKMRGGTMMIEYLEEAGAIARAILAAANGEQK